MIGKDYDFEDKDRWRLWKWDLIGKRFEDQKISLSEVSGAYLPAEQDLDRRVACERGFKPSNLIPLERNKETINHLRKQDKTVLEGDAWESLTLMDPFSIEFVDLDLCGPCSLTNLRGLMKFVACPTITPGGVVSINLQAGREYYGPAVNLSSLDMPDWMKKHRGIWALFSVLVYDGEHHYGLCKKNIRVPCSELIGIHNLRINELIEWSDPVIYSYRSGNLRFDSIVFNIWELTSHRLLQMPWEIRKKVLPAWRNKSEEDLRELNKKRSPWINFKAIRTQRLQRRLPPCPSK